MSRKTPSFLGLWNSALETQMAMWVTLGVRVPQLMAGTMSAAEQTRMVSEKTAALTESSQAAAVKLGQMMMSPARTPAALMQSMMTLTASASDPFHKRVTANAKRLSRGKPRRSR